MSLIISGLTWLYQLLLCTYPEGFRDEFRREMQAALDNHIIGHGEEPRS